MEKFKFIKAVYSASKKTAKSDKRPLLYKRNFS